MYQVFLVNKDNKNYYYSYIVSDDTSLGNITTDTLPPYQDIMKARSCYYENGEWIYNDNKYINDVREKEKADNIAKHELTNDDKIAAFLDTIPVEYPYGYDYTTCEFPEKMGYKWKLFYSGSSFVWEMVVDDNYEWAQKGHDYTDPLEWFNGVTVEKGLWYDVDHGTIWQAIKTGIPKSADDKEYFDIP